MYKSKTKITIAVLVLWGLSLNMGCGVKTDPVAPESPYEVAPIKKKQDKEKEDAR